MSSAIFNAGNSCSGNINYDRVKKLGVIEQQRRQQQQHRDNRGSYTCNDSSRASSTEEAGAEAGGCGAGADDCAAAAAAAAGGRALDDDWLLVGARCLPLPPLPPVALFFFFDVECEATCVSYSVADINNCDGCGVNPNIQCVFRHISIYRQFKIVIGIKSVNTIQTNVGMHIQIFRKELFAAQLSTKG
jgi:hypothetical protein